MTKLKIYNSFTPESLIECQNDKYVPLTMPEIINCILDEKLSSKQSYLSKTVLIEGKSKSGLNLIGVNHNIEDIMNLNVMYIKDKGLVKTLNGKKFYNLIEDSSFIIPAKNVPLDFEIKDIREHPLFIPLFGKNAEKYFESKKGSFTNMYKPSFDIHALRPVVFNSEYNSIDVLNQNNFKFAKLIAKYN